MYHYMIPNNELLLLYIYYYEACKRISLLSTLLY